MVAQDDDKGVSASTGSMGSPDDSGTGPAPSDGVPKGQLLETAPPLPAAGASRSQIMQAMVRLESTTIMLRGRIVKLQDELEKKDAQMKELAVLKKTADDQLDEMSDMLQAVHLRLNAVMGKSGRRGELAVQIQQAVSKHAEKAFVLIRSIEIQQLLSDAIRPLVASVHVIRRDHNTLRRIVTDKLAMFQHTIHIDVKAFVQFAISGNAVPLPIHEEFSKERSKSLLETRRLFRGLVRLLASKLHTLRRDHAHLHHFVTDKVAAFQSALHGEMQTVLQAINSAIPAKPEPPPVAPEPPKPECDQPHLTTEVMGQLQETVGQLMMATREFTATAGLAIKVPKLAAAEDPQRQLADLEAALRAMHQQVEVATGDLVEKLALEEAVNTTQLQRMENEQLEMQRQFEMCADLMTKAGSDSTARELLPTAFAEAALCLEKTPKTADKACQCSLMSAKDGATSLSVDRGKDGGKVRSPSLYVTAKGTHPERSPQTAITPPSVENAALKAIGTIENMLNSVPEDSPMRHELELLLADARKLNDEDPSPQHPNRFRPPIPEDRRAVERFQQWQLKRKVQLIRQRVLLTSLFRTLQGAFHESYVPRPPASTLEAPSVQFQAPTSSPNFPLSIEAAGVPRTGVALSRSTSRLLTHIEPPMGRSASMMFPHEGPSLVISPRVVPPGRLVPSTPTTAPLFKRTMTQLMDMPTRILPVVQTPLKVPTAPLAAVQGDSLARRRGTGLQHLGEPETSGSRRKVSHQPSSQFPREETGIFDLDSPPDSIGGRHAETPPAGSASRLKPTNGVRLEPMHLDADALAEVNSLSLAHLHLF